MLSGITEPVPASPLFRKEEAEEASWLIERALAEDVPGGDLTTRGLFVPGAPGAAAAPIRAAFAARSAGVLCGVPVVEDLFSRAAGVVLRAARRDGDRLAPGERFLEASGAASEILPLERIALNFLGRLSGVATETGRWVEALAGTGVRLLDTRKTTPGWRRLEKYAVRAGGGENHRMSLSDGILLKDNHRSALAGAVAAGRLRDWVDALRRSSPGVFLQVEVDSRDELLEALDARPDSILLDNFALEDLAWAVEARNRRGPGGPTLEASGGIRLENVRRVAMTGVDRISVGALTHSARALDIGLDVLGGAT